MVTGGAAASLLCLDSTGKFIPGVILSNQASPPKHEVVSHNQRGIVTFAKSVEEGMERLLFGGRWLLAPFYLGLLGGLVVLVFKFLVEFWHLLGEVADFTIQETVLGTLELLDIALLGNLIVIVIFSGYENFVSKISVAEGSVDRPTWMGKVDFSGLKIKLIGSLVAISVIELLKDFLDPAGIDPEQEFWLIAIHLTFVVSGVLFAVMDFIADKRASVGLAAQMQYLQVREKETAQGLSPGTAAAQDLTDE